MATESILTGLGVLIVFGLIVRFHQTRINKMDEIKVDKEMCDRNHEEVDKNLNRGTTKFDQIDEKLEDHGGGCVFHILFLPVSVQHLHIVSRVVVLNPRRLFYLYSMSH